MKGRTGWCIALAWVAACARSQIPAFSELDDNNDGRIEAAEAERSPAIRAVFQEVDMDQDGQLTVGEYLEAINRS